VGEFVQSFERVTGTILTPTGDHRFLAGEVHGDELYLSRFDGASAYLYRARLDDNGDLAGEYWSGKTGHQRFTARRDPNAELDTSPVATGLRTGRAARVLLPRPRWQSGVAGRPRIPRQGRDRHAGGQLVPELPRRSRLPRCPAPGATGRGLEVVSLMFEHFGDFEQGAAATRRFREKFGIEYATLIAGTSDQGRCRKALPQLTGVFAYPTTIWVDRSGTVRKIHAGFSGAGDGPAPRGADPRIHRVHARAAGRTACEWSLTMPSFDIVSEIDLHEVTNAVDQASREVSQRFDFKGTNAKFELKGRGCDALGAC